MRHVNPTIMIDTEWEPQVICQWSSSFALELRLSGRSPRSVRARTGLRAVVRVLKAASSNPPPPPPVPSARTNVRRSPPPSLLFPRPPTPTTTTKTTTHLNLPSLVPRELLLLLLLSFHDHHDFCENSCVARTETNWGRVKKNE